MMNWETAYEVLVNGGKVKRENWDFYLICVDSENVQLIKVHENEDYRENFNIEIENHKEEADWVEVQDV